MCQGAPPNGTYIRTSEGIEQHVAAQVLSRFMLGYALTVDAYCVVKKGLMTVMEPGFRWSALDLDGIDMPWHASMLLVRLYRYGHDFACRTPSVTFPHVQPGAVKTEFASHASLPWYLSSFLNVGLAVMGQTPASYPEVPFYLLVNPVRSTATSSCSFGTRMRTKWQEIRLFRMRAQERHIWDYLMEKMNAVL
ncbi:hypothetical protein JB92DRAFT_3128963 [Gautieria morchelliformis]|nr:hypothetical protein JB92DRAFT_3128963 [Gautieria morchelliformis]